MAETAPDKPYPLAPEESDAAYWQRAANEVGIYVLPGQQIDAETVWERRRELADSLGMSPTGWDGWTSEHGRAARIAVDLCVETIDDAQQLGEDTHELLRRFVRSTYHNTEGLMPAGRIISLAQMAEIRDARVQLLKEQRGE
jgi:hypothetical protein